MLGLSRRSLATGALAAMAACSKGPVAAEAPGQVNLAAAARARGVIFGAAAEAETIDRDGDFAALIARQCDLLTAENALKWNALRPGIHDFAFARSDRLVDLAIAGGQALHGHTLVWHEALPDWFAGHATPANAEGLLREHIRRVVGRYAGRIASWDVVNEIVERNDKRPDGLRLSPWMKLLGPRYIDIAFAEARAADPSARLVLADYGLEYDDETWMVEKRGTLLALLRAMLSRGVPLHALAIQGHIYGHRPPAFGSGFKTFLAQVAGLGLDIYITELDVDDQKVAGSIAERDRRCAEVYRAFLDACLSQPRVKMVVTWGLSDRYSSKGDFFPRPDGAKVRPLPFDDQLRPKPSAHAIQAAFTAVEAGRRNRG